MNAKKCDRCGCYYTKNEPVANNKDSGERIVIHGIRIWKTLQTYGSHGYSNEDATEVYDLCDHCAKRLIDWMAAPSLKEEEV